MTKLILGTAQFGSDYGVKHDGQPSEKEIENIARVAWDGGIRVIHTSWQYGLPKICEAIFSEFEWIEKDKNDPDLFHWGERVGFSSYGQPMPWSSVLTMVNLPINILGNHYLNFARWVRKNDWTILVRSVFLQGLLLMEELPSWVQGQARAHIKLFHHICRKEQYEYYEAALGWVLGLDEIDKVIVGVNSARQLEQLLKVSPLKWDYDFSITDEMILDPRKWPKAS